LFLDDIVRLFIVIIDETIIDTKPDMKKIKPITLLLIVFILLNQYSNANYIKHVSSNLVFDTPNSNEKAVVFVRDFLKWYKTKYGYLYHTLRFIDLDLKHPAPYKINYRETEEYLSALKNSGFFSKNYLNYYKSYFKAIDLKLQKTKQNDGPVDGLDSDLIMHTQEPESYLNHLNVLQLSQVKSSGNSRIVIVKMKTNYNNGGSLLFYLIEANGKYLIDKIESK